ncbi:MAG: 16S rRNA (uracil(1498)-N(3))-methyltransferase [Thermoanaerobaculales bacterium]
MKTAPWLLVAPGELEEGATLVLDPAEARHASGLLRRRPGDEVTLVDGTGLVAEATLVSIGRRRSEVVVRHVRSEPESSDPGVVLALAVLDGSAMDWAVGKAVEVGVRRLRPVLTERVQPNRRGLARRGAHWRRIALQAIKQCHRPWAMEVSEPQSLGGLIEEENPLGGGIVADRSGCPVDHLASAARNLLLVGPEGGFSATENSLLAESGWPRLRLGVHVLRAETAAIVGSAMLAARLDSPYE